MDANLLQSALAERDEAAQPVIKNVHRPGKVAADALCGRFGVERETDGLLARGQRFLIEGRMQYGRLHRPY